MSKRSEAEWDAVVRARCKATAQVRCRCGRWSVSVGTVGERCWTCKETLKLVGARPPMLAPLPPDELEEQEAGLERARRALGAVPA